MSKIFLPLIAATLIWSCSKKVIPKASISDNSITIGNKITIHSKILNEDRTIWIYVPSNPYFSEQKYPVAYLLDGNIFFSATTGMIQQLSEQNNNTVCPQMIVVGIQNTKRVRDLTPTIDSVALKGVFAKISGGGEKFMSFIEKELIPYIDSAYATAPYRMLIGHSLGGLTVVNTLLHRPYLFNSYVAIDPSMWWDRQKLLKDFSRSDQKYAGKTFYLAMANSFPPGFDTSNVRQDTSTHPRTFHPHSILEFADLLKQKPNNGLRYNWKYYHNDDHTSLPLIAEYDAFRFVFNYYKVSKAEMLLDSTITNVDSLFARHFRNVSNQMGYSVLPPENFVNNWGYGFKGYGMMDKSYACFNLNIVNYPNSYNAYDSIGDFYETKGDKKKALEYYLKAYAIKDVSFIKDKIERLNERK